MKRQIARCFSKAAHTYDAHAKFQLTVGERLSRFMPSSLEWVKYAWELGVGTGLTTERWLAHVGQAQSIVCDLSLDMLRIAQQRLGDKVHCVQADFDCLPFNQACDFIFSNMSLQWSEDLESLLNRLIRCLTHEGCLLVSIPINFRHSSEDLPFSLGFSPVLLSRLEEKHNRLRVSYESIDWWFDTTYDFIQFFKKTGANFRNTDISNGSVIKKIERKNYANLLKPLGKVTIDLAYIVFSKNN